VHKGTALAIPKLISTGNQVSFDHKGHKGIAQRSLRPSGFKCYKGMAYGHGICVNGKTDVLFVLNHECRTISKSIDYYDIQIEAIR
jgi:hypothetical protein